MDRVNINPVFIGFLYILRCLVPLAVMLGISYLLRRFGLIKEPPPPPADWNDTHEDNAQSGDLAHG
jgi:hypothetical protein